LAHRVLDLVWLVGLSLWILGGAIVITKLLIIQNLMSLLGSRQRCLRPLLKQVLMSVFYDNCSNCERAGSRPINGMEHVIFIIDIAVHQVDGAHAHEVLEVVAARLVCKIIIESKGPLVLSSSLSQGLLVGSPKSADLCSFI